MESPWLALLGPSQKHAVTGVQRDYLPTLFSKFVELVDLTGTGKTGADDLVFPFLELWDAVRSRIVAIKERFGVSRYGGVTRTSKSRQYLFSGLLICGLCGSRLVIVSGNGRRGYVKYGCPSHRYRGICSNRLTMRQDRLEAQLVSAIEACALTPQMIDYTVRRFEEELARRTEENRGRKSGASVLEAERTDLQAQARRLMEAVAAAGHSPSLLSHLASIEARLARIQREIDTFNPESWTMKVEEARNFVLEHVTHLRYWLHDGAGRARTALMKHVKQLILTPEDRPSGPVNLVTGTMDMPVTKNDVMPEVARDGTEPPPPAFQGYLPNWPSGLESADVTDGKRVASEVI